MTRVIHCPCGILVRVLEELSLDVQRCPQCGIPLPRLLARVLTEDDREWLGECGIAVWEVGVSKTASLESEKEREVERDG